MDNMPNYQYRWDNYYCYPNSKVLKNLLSIRTDEELAAPKEEVLALCYAQLLQEHMAGLFDFYHLKCIHKHLFKEIYQWAGKQRTVNPSKFNPFCDCASITERANALFLELKKENHLKNCKTKETIAPRLAYYLGELNNIHPFREGNRLTGQIFIEHLSWRAGFQLDIINITAEKMDEAYGRAIESDYSLLKAIILKGLTKRE